MRDPEIAALNEVWEASISSGVRLARRSRRRFMMPRSPIKAVEVNSRASGTFNYADHEKTGLNVIAVGGFSLSRGLTLEGLMISYFLRNSMMYDTLMQMGRWFGYRPGYEDLCRSGCRRKRRAGTRTSPSRSRCCVKNCEAWKQLVPRRKSSVSRSAAIRTRSSSRRGTRWELGRERRRQYRSWQQFRRNVHPEAGCAQLEANRCAAANSQNDSARRDDL